MLESVVDPGAEPGLFAVTRFNEMAEADKIRLMLENPGERVAYQLDESRAVWKAVEPFIMSEQEEGRSVVVEGVAVLPALVNQLADVAARVVFIGNQGEHHRENIKRSAQQNSHDWMRDASEAYIDAFATFVVQMSRYVEKEAHEHGFEYLEMGNKPFDVAVGETVVTLLHRSKSSGEDGS